MTDLKINIDKEEDDGEVFYNISCLFTIGEVTIGSMVLDEPLIITSEKYTEFASGDHSCEMEFCDSNGYVGIIHDTKMVKFMVCRMGSGGGTISIKIPFAECKEELSKLAKWRVSV